MSKFTSHVFEFIAGASWWGVGGYPRLVPSTNVTTYASNILADSPYSYWRLNETSGTSAIEEVSDRDGVYSGGYTFEASALVFQSDDAVHFNGTNGRITISSAPKVGVSTWAVEAWVQCSASCTGGGIVAEQWTGGSNAIHYEIGPGISLGASPPNSYCAVAYYSGGGWVDAQDSRAFPLTDITHVVGVKEEAELKLYINGIEVDATTCADGPPYGTANAMYIGKRHDTGAANDYFHGIIDEVAIYSSALTSTEVWDHYRHGQGWVDGTYPLVVTEDNPLRYWRLDEHELVNLRDSITNDLLTRNQGLKTNLRKSGLLNSANAGNINRGVYFSATGGAAASNPVFYDRDIQTGGNTIHALECWFNSDMDANNRHPACVYISNTNRSVFRLTGTTKRLDIFSGATGASVLTNGVSVETSTTHHAVLTWEGNIGRSRLFYDGILADATSTQPGGMDGGGNADVLIGGFDVTGTPQGSMKGTVDEVACYATSLTAGQVHNHYVLGAGVNSFQKQLYDLNPALWFMFDETHGTVAFDAAGYQHGTYAGSTTFAGSAIHSNSAGGKSVHWGTTGSALVSCAANTDMQPGTNNFTICCMISAVVSTGDKAIVDTRNTGAGFLIGTKTGVIVGNIDDGTSSVTVSGGFVTDETAHLISVIFNRTDDIMTMMVDGSVTNTSSIAAITGNANGGVAPNIGYRKLSGDSFNHWLGKIDEFTYYTTALTTATIEGLATIAGF